MTGWSPRTGSPGSVFSSIRKPDPQPYLVAIEQMDLPAQDIVFIDDNPTYVRGGEAVGLQSLLLDVRNPGEVFIDAAKRLGLTD